MAGQSQDDLRSMQRVFLLSGSRPCTFMYRQEEIRSSTCESDKISNNDVVMFVVLYVCCFVFMSVMIAMLLWCQCRLLFYRAHGAAYGAD